jgi:hypothetical protein
MKINIWIEIQWLIMVMEKKTKKSGQKKLLKTSEKTTDSFYT